MTSALATICSGDLLRDIEFARLSGIRNFMASLNVSGVASSILWMIFNPRCKILIPVAARTFDLLTTHQITVCQMTLVLGI